MSLTDSRRLPDDSSRNLPDTERLSTFGEPLEIVSFDFCHLERIFVSKVSDDMRLEGPRVTWEPSGGGSPVRRGRHLSTPHPDSLPAQGRRRRSRSLQNDNGEEGHVGQMVWEDGLSSTTNAMKEAMKSSHGDPGRRR